MTEPQNPLQPRETGHQPAQGPLPRDPGPDAGALRAAAAGAELGFAETGSAGAHPRSGAGEAMDGARGQGLEGADFGQIYRAHVRSVADHIQRRLGNPSQVEDLVAEVFLKALGALPRYRTGRAPLRHWLLRIASNVVHSHLRRQGLRRAASFEERDAPVSNHPKASPQAERLRHALRTLPERWQTVLSLHYLEGLDVDEIAAALGCRPGTVKSRLSRGRTALRRRMEGGHDAP